MAANLLRLEDQLLELVEAKIDVVHIDVMDGRFVKNFMFGPSLVEQVRRATSMRLDVHLMITTPAQYVPSFIEAGASTIQLHIEAGPSTRLLRQIRKLGVGVGLVLNPTTPVTAVHAYLDYVDQCVLMSAPPGWCNQQFDRGVLPKIESLFKVRQHQGSRFEIVVDGSVDLCAIREVAAAGANVIVVGGKALFKCGVPLAAAVYNLNTSAAEGQADAGVGQSRIVSL
jgi:ribulose-phosphate 3-epimerase